MGRAGGPGREPAGAGYRLTGVKRIAPLLVGAAILAGCTEPTVGGSPASLSTTTTSTTTRPAGPTDADRAAVLALALERLVREENTFEVGHAFTELLVQAHLDPAAGTGMATGGPGRALTPAERATIEDALSGLAPVRWIDDPADWRTEDLRPTVEGAAIVGVGEPQFDDRGALVPVSLWCGGVCGTWFSYRLSVSDGAWSVVGSEGPIFIS